MHQDKVFSCPDTQHPLRHPIAILPEEVAPCQVYTGFCVQLGKFPVSWKSRKEDLVSQFSAKSEYRAIAVTSDITWLLALLKDMNVPNLELVQLYQRSSAQCL